MPRKLNIAVFGTASLPIPPYQGYGGTQRGVYDFLVHMDTKGHSLHLFGPGDCQVDDLENVVLHSFVDNSLWIPGNQLPTETKRSEEARHYRRSIEKMQQLDRLQRFDIINVRTDARDTLQEITERFGAERIVYGLHNLKNTERLELIKQLGIQCVAHCRDHREQYENLDNIRVIVYGINVDTYPFTPEPLQSSEEEPELPILRRLKNVGVNYLINLGNVGKHKGQRTCIRLAQETGNTLILVGTPQIRTSNEKEVYFEREVAPHIDGRKVIHLGNATEEEKKELIRFAKGFLFPSGYEDATWNEPFGRAPVEALSCGVPVVAFRKGSMSEVIFDGFNGFLFDSLNEAIDSVDRLESIRRGDCRRTAEKKFHSRRVADEYEALFYQMLERQAA